jgi:hypothetical protein
MEGWKEYEKNCTTKRRGRIEIETEDEVGQDAKGPSVLDSLSKLSNM